MPWQVPVERVALNALANWLDAQFATLEGTEDAVAIFTQWPDPDVALPPRAVSLIYAGDLKEELCEPTVEATEVIHRAVSPRIAVPTASDLAGALDVLNACRASYEAHRPDTDAHAAADTANVITSPSATNQQTAYDLAVELYADVTTHLQARAYHPTADSENGLSGGVTNTEAGLVAAAEAIRNALDRHYAARVYVWRIAGCEQPVQLDVWALYEDSREDIMARLVPILNADPAESAGWSYSEPARNGVVVPLGDGWPGYAQFLFDSPRRETTTTSQKQSEFRAMYRGTCEVWLLVKKQSARIVRATLRQVIDGMTAATAVVSTSSGEPTTTYTLS